MTLFARPARFLAPLALIQFAFVALYIGAEDSVHFWDYAMYANMALSLFSLPEQASSLGFFFQSFASKYNLLFAVPSQMSFALFGAKRDVFVLTNFVVFFLAHEVAIGFVLRRVFDLSWARALVWSLVLCPLIPFMWYPLLQGYPDNSAAACLVFAFGLLLGEKKSWREALAAGALLGLSVVFRRHYAYPVLAVLLTFGGIEAALLLRGGADGLLKRARSPIGYYGAVGLALVATLLCIEPAYIHEILTTNYTILYKSYEQTPSYFTLFFLSRVGAVLLLPVFAGFVGQSIPGSVPTRPMLVVATTTLMWLALWAFGPAQAGDHYLISLAPVCCAVGLYGLFTTKDLAGATRPALIIVMLGLCINTAQAFWFSDFVLPSDKPIVSFLSSPRPPWVRDDMDALNFIAATVIHKTTDSDRIAIGGSSFVFNQDIMRSLLVDGARRPDVAARFIPAPESDGEQEPPLDAYAAANIFLIASPPQYHLAPEGQKVITGLVERFPPPPELSVYYEKDKQAFRLMNDVIITVWRRKSELPPALLHKELTSIRKLKRSDKMWITSKAGGVVQLGKDTTRGDVVVFHHGAGGASSSLFYDNGLGSGNYRIKSTLQVHPACRDVSVTAITKKGDGTITSSQTTAVLVSDGLFYLPLKIEATDRGNSYLELRLNTTAPTDCTVALWQLQLEQMSP